ncbi:MAG: hypothetical protein M1818_005439 [Claussenomyces sp. TS43310]|nr:MAG: hypothetical protein M1818_005439 [Claussenomyces sp. TS43310]
MGPDDTPSAAIKRAKSYIFVGNSLTFALGPKLLGDEELSEEEENEPVNKHNNGLHEHQPDEERLGPRIPSARTWRECEEYQDPTNADGRTAEQEEEHETETTTLLPYSLAQ